MENRQNWESRLDSEVGAQIKTLNTQAQIVQLKFLIGKTQAQIAQKKSVKRKRKLRIN